MKGYVYGLGRQLLAIAVMLLNGKNALAQNGCHWNETHLEEIYYSSMGQANIAEFEVLTEDISSGKMTIQTARIVDKKVIVLFMIKHSHYLVNMYSLTGEFEICYKISFYRSNPIINVNLSYGNLLLYLHVSRCVYEFDGTDIRYYRGNIDMYYDNDSVIRNKWWYIKTFKPECLLVVRSERYGDVTIVDHYDEYITLHPQRGFSVMNIIAILMIGGLMIFIILDYFVFTNPSLRKGSKARQTGARKA